MLSEAGFQEAEGPLSLGRKGTDAQPEPGGWFGGSQGVAGHFPPELPRAVQLFLVLWALRAHWQIPQGR